MPRLGDKQALPTPPSVNDAAVTIQNGAVKNVPYRLLPLSDAALAAVNALQAQINQLAAIVGTAGSPSIPTVVANVAFAGALTPGVQQGIVPAKWSGATVTISNASPAVVTWANHGLKVGDDLVFNTTGALPTGLTAGTTYYVIAAGLTSGAFQLSATQGGSAINTSSAGSGVHTVMGIIPSSRVWHVYENGVIDSFPNRTLPNYTPDSAAAGLPAYVIEDATARNGSGIVQSTSAVVVVDAPSSFSATLNQAIISGTAGQPIVSVAPVVFTGAAGTVTLAISPSLSGTGLSFNTTTGVISGTPSTALSGRYTVTGTDSADTLNPIAVGFDFNISAAGVVPATAPAYTSASPAISGDNTTYNGVDAKLYSGQVVLGPNGDGRNRHRLINGAPSIAGGVRNELLWFGETLNAGELVCFGFDFKFDLPSEFPAASTGDDSFAVFQCHTPYSGDTQPDIACFMARQDGLIKWRIAGNDAAPVSGSQTTKTPQPSYFGSQSLVQGRRYRFAVEMVPGWLAGHNPRIDIWVRNDSAGTWTKLVDNYTTYPNTYNNGGGTSNRSYLRIGGYKWSSSVWNNSPIAWVESPLYIARGANAIARVMAAVDQLAP